MIVININVRTQSNRTRVTKVRNATEVVTYMDLKFYKNMHSIILNTSVFRAFRA